MIDPSSHFEEHHRRAGAHKYRDMTVGVSCLVMGVVVLFVLLRVLYQPYLRGGPERFLWRSRSESLSPPGCCLRHQDAASQEFDICRTSDSARPFGCA